MKKRIIGLFSVLAMLCTFVPALPASAAAEAFGCSVDWDGDNKTVIINQ